MQIESAAHAGQVLRAMSRENVELLVRQMRREFGCTDKQARDRLRQLAK